MFDRAYSCKINCKIAILKEKFEHFYVSRKSTQTGLTRIKLNSECSLSLIAAYYAHKFHNEILIRCYSIK